MLQCELQEFLEETADAAFSVNPQGEICSWNEAAEKVDAGALADPGLKSDWATTPLTLETPVRLT